MVRKSPNKAKKSKPSQGGSSAAPSIANLSSALFDPATAPKLDPQDETEPWSPTKPSLRSPVKPLADQVTSLQQEKNLIENKLWDATVELQEKATQKKADEDHISRLQAELVKLRSEHEAASEALESLRNRESNLDTALKSSKEHFMQEKRQTLEKLEARDQFIDRLQQQIDDLKSQLDQRSPEADANAAPKGDTEPSAKNADTSLSSNYDVTEDASFAGSIIPQTPSSNELLASLSRSRRQQKALRDLLNKQRRENLDLRKQLSEYTGTEVPEWDFDVTNSSSIGLGDGDDDTFDLQHDLHEGETKAAAAFTLSEDLENDEAVPPSSSRNVIPDSLHDQAEALQHKLVPYAEYERLANQASKQSNQSPGFDELKRLAEQLNYSVMSHKEFDDINKLLHGKKPTSGVVKSHVLQDLVRQKAFPIHLPSDDKSNWVISDDMPETVRAYANKHDLALIPNAAITELVDRLTFSSSEEGTPEVSSIRSSPSKYPNFNNVRADSLNYNPTREDVASAAAALGLAVIPVKQFEQIKKGMVSQDIPTAAEVASLAGKAGMLVIPENPSIDELQQVVSDDIVLVERSTYEALESPGPATLTRLAKRHDMVVLPKHEIESLRHSKQGNKGEVDNVSKTKDSSDAAAQDLSLDTLRDIASKKDMVLLSSSDYEQMLKARSLHDFNNLPMAQRTKFFEDLIQIQGSPTSPHSRSPASSLGSMEDRARRMGFILVKPEEYQELKQTKLAYEPTKADVIQAAKSHGLATMPIDEYSKLRSQKWKVASSKKSPTAATSKAAASAAQEDDEFKAVPAGYLSALQRIAENPAKQDVVSMAAKVGLTVMNPEEQDTLVRTRAKDLGLIEAPTEEELVKEAKKLGLDYPPSEEQILKSASELGWGPHLSRSEIVEKARDLGLADPRSWDLQDPEIQKAIKQHARSLGLIEPLSDEDIKAAAKNLGLISPLPTEKLKAEAMKLGLIEPLSGDDIETEAKKLGLIEPLSDDDMKTEAKKLGLIEPLCSDDIKNEAKKLGLIEPLSDDEIRSRAKQLGLIEPLSDDEIRSRAKQLGLIEPLSDDEIRSRAKQLGLTEPLSDDKIKAHAKNIGLIEPLSDDEIKAHARKLGLVEPLSSEDTKAEAKKLGLIEPLSDDDIKAQAKRLGLIEPLSSDDIKTEAKKLGLIEPPSSEDIKTEARKIGLVEPLSDDEIKTKARKFGLCEPLSDKEIMTKANGLGLVNRPSNDEIKSEAKRLGLIEPISIDELKSIAVKLGMIEPLSEDDIRSEARKLGLVESLSAEEVRSEAKKLGLTEPLTNEEVISKAEKLGMTQPLSTAELKSKAMEIGLIEPLSEREIREKARSFGMVDAVTEDDIKARAKKIGLLKPLSDEDIRAKAKQLRMVQPMTKDEIISAAKNAGLVEPLSKPDIIERAKSLGLKETPTQDQILNEAKQLGLVDPPTNEEILSKAKQLGLVEPLSLDDVKSVAKTLGLVEPLSEPELEEEAKKLGYTKPLSNKEIKSRAKDLGLRSYVSDDEIMEKAKSLGMRLPLSETELREKAKELGLSEPLNDEDIVSKAKKMGLTTPPTKEEIKEMAKNLGLVEPPSKQEIFDAAQKMGLSEPLSNEALVSKAKHLGFEPALTEDEIKSRATKLGFVDPTSIQELKARARELGLTDSLTQDELIARAKEIGLVDPSTLPAAATSARSPDAATGHENVAKEQASQGQPQTTQRTPNHSFEDGNSEFKFSDGEAGSVDVFLPLSQASDAGSPAVSPVSSNAGDGSGQARNTDSTSTLTAGRNNVAREASEADNYTSATENMSTNSATPRRTVRRWEVRSTRAPRNNANIPRSTTTSSISSRWNILPTPNAPFARHMKTNSDSTDASNQISASVRSTRTGLSDMTFSNPAFMQIIGDDFEQLLSQVMIGEVLYKYYGGLNFEGLTGGRHRRYFWFRPESRTLYWHRENPQFFESSNAKQLTVVQIDEVVDRNPIPAGLYHRSLVIKGMERDVRVTCLTQSRHYVWFAVLRHVLSQNNAND